MRARSTSRRRSGASEFQCGTVGKPGMKTWSGRGKQCVPTMRRMEFKYRTRSTGVVGAVASSRRVEPAEIVQIVNWCTQNLGPARANGWGFRVQERAELTVSGDGLQKLSPDRFFDFELWFCTEDSAAMFRMAHEAPAKAYGSEAPIQLSVQGA